MYTNLNPRTMGLNHHPFEALLAAAHANHFKGIEVPAGAFGSREAAKDAARRMDDLGMRFGLIMAPCDMYKVDDATFEQAVVTFGKWAELARLAGCTRAFNHIWPGSNERAYEENFDWHVRRLTAIFKVLDDQGIQYGLEYMGPKTVQAQFRHPFIRSLLGILNLSGAVSGKIGFVFDTFHWYCAGAREDDLQFAVMHPERIVNLHLSDANADLPREEQIDSWRALPGENGVIDAVGILRLLEQHGYTGPVVLEPMNPTVERYTNMALDDAARDAITCLHQVFGAAGVVEQ